MKLSKAVSDKLKVGRAVGRAIDVRGAEVAEALGPLLAADESDKAFTCAELVEALGAALAGIEVELEAADLAHAAELADDGAYREQRDTARAELAELLLRARAVITASHGSPQVAYAGLAGALPRGNQELVGYARHAVGRLSAEVLGEPTDELVPINLDALRKRISEAADALEGSLSELERERREAQQTLERRDTASEAWARTYVGVANAFVALATLTGFDELADRVKPTARRRAGRPEPEDEVAVDAGEGPASESPASESPASEGLETEVDATGE